MKAEIKGYMTSDCDPLEDYKPDDFGYFSVDIEVAIGVEGTEGSDSFIFTVTTPKCLEDKIDDNDAIFLRHYNLVKEWSPDLIKGRLEKLVSNTSGKTWKELADKFSRFGRWEFEDVRPIKR